MGVFFIPIKKQKQRSLNFSKNKDLPLSADKGQAHALNVFFNFNGHSFDAYEALGVPAGSTLEEIQQAFNKSIQSSDAASQEFFAAALNAIKQAQLRR